MKLDKPLFIFEMANNHQGDVEHGKTIIKEIKKVVQGFNFNFAFKFQYRDINTFIHPEYREAYDFKNIKRFKDTRLTEKEFIELKEEAKNNGFITMCTPFDEVSVEKIIKHNYDILKIASCSFTDWSLLEKVVNYDKEIILSTAGAEVEDIDKVVAFLKHRNKKFALMHCVAQYPTSEQNVEINQIEFLKNRYKDITIGYSTHEEPSNYKIVQLAVAKGAKIFEKHVGIQNEKYSLNKYSANPQQIYNWLKAAEEAYKICGVQNTRYTFSIKEIQSLESLKRGIFAVEDIKKGEKISIDKIFRAIPTFNNQIVANDLSKYKTIIANKDISKNSPIYKTYVEVIDITTTVKKCVIKVIELIKNSNVVIPKNTKCELSHHYGIERFNEVGASIISIINREYCKKVMVLLPGQRHPAHYHKKKEETFNILYGEVYINLNGVEEKYKKGDIVLVKRDVMHSFHTETGAIFEEISTTHFNDDSYYEDEEINKNKERKTVVYLTEELL